MGKKQHQKDKMYLTYTEWSTLYGGKRPGKPSSEEVTFKRLPYDHCCITMQPFESPYCDQHGNIFDLQAILDFMKKYKINPVTGKSMDAKSLVKLVFHKNTKGEYHCPVLFKPFTKNSHIVAVGVTGNVFSYEAIEQLNIKGKNWKDLLNDEPYDRKDLITIQDPNDLNKFNISSFHHVKNKMDTETDEERLERSQKIKTVSNEAREIMSELERDYKAPVVEVKEKVVADKFNAAHYSTGAVAASFTSTAMVPETTHEAAIIHEDEVRYDRVKKKGYVRMVTNQGQLNFELHCDIVPKTCENFMKLCQNGYYIGVKFHRSIRNFMVQGGDPTGSGLGGESIWKKKFEDEIKPNLHHSGRGILSMANSGPNTNGSQFFITYRSCKHLDGKHTIFGKLVGGMDTLNTIEKIDVDNKDRPIEHIIIRATQVFVDPFQEADEQLQKEREEELKAQALAAAQKGKATTRGQLKVYRQGVGKYLKMESDPAPKPTEGTSKEPPKKKSKNTNYSFQDFSSW